MFKSAGQGKVKIGQGNLEREKLIPWNGGCVESPQESGKKRIKEIVRVKCTGNKTGGEKRREKRQKNIGGGGSDESQLW